MSIYLPLLAIRGVTFGAPAVLFVIFAAVFIALAVIVYRYTLPPVSAPRKTLLAGIRALVLTLILFLIFEPVLRWLDRRDEHDKIVLLVDRSASMAIADKGIVRDSSAMSFLRHPALTSLVKQGNVRTFAFADSAIQTSLDSASAMSPSQVGTNPARAWTIAKSALSSEDIGAIVLVSDGAQNSGPNPEREATLSNVPIFTVGVGDSTLRRDALIADLLTNNIAYKGTQVPVQVRIRAQGLAGQVSRLRLVSSDARTLLDESVSFDGSLYENTYTANFLADKEGELRVTAILDSVAAEATTENNRRSRVIRILDSKYNVLLIAGRPSPDVTFVRQALGRDTTMDVTAFVETKSGFVGGKSVDQETARNAELIVLIDYPTSASNRQTWDVISNRLNQDGVPLLYVHGPDVSLSSLASIAPRLPVEFSSQAASKRVLLREASTHPAITARGPLPANWSDLPPALGSVGQVKLKSAATQIATFADELTPEVPGGPAVALSELSRRRAAAITVAESYRWSLGMAKAGSGTEFHSDLMSRLSAWLLAPSEEKQVKITTDKKVYSTGEQIHVQGQVYNADLSPVNDAVVLVEVKEGDKSELLSLRGKGNGLYEAQLSAWGAGDYSFSGSAILHIDTLGSDRGSFVVEAFNLELLDARARWDVLQAISRNSGGLFVSADRPDSLFEKLNMPSRVVESSREIPLWNKPLFLWILIGLLALEWLLRKRSGML